MRLKLGKIMPFVLALGVLLALPTTVFAADVAQIDDGNTYATLELAIEAFDVESDVKINLLADIKLDSTLAITKNVTIDGTKTVTSDGDVETKYGITYEGSGSAIVIKYTEATLQNLSVSATKGVAVHMFEEDSAIETTVTIDNCTLTADQPLYIGGYRLWYNDKTNFADSGNYSYGNELVVTDSELTSTQSIITFQSATFVEDNDIQDTTLANKISITGSILTTDVSLVQFDENGSANCSGLQDITMNTCTIDMTDDGAAAISVDHANVAASGVFFAELQMDDSTLKQIPGIAYALGAKGGLVANIYDLVDFTYAFSGANYGGYGSATSGYYYYYTKTLQLAKDIDLGADTTIYLGGSSNTDCANATLDLNGCDLTLKNDAILSLRAGSSGYTVSVIDSSDENEKGSIIIDGADNASYGTYIKPNNNAVIWLSVDALDKYVGVISTSIISDLPSDWPTMLYGDTFAIFVGDSMTYEEKDKLTGVVFTNIPEDLTILNSTGAEWTFTVDDDSVTLAAGESYPLPVYVAEIEGGDQYESLEDAIKNVGANGTITLLSDIKLDEQLYISTDTAFTLDGTKNETEYYTISYESGYQTGTTSYAALLLTGNTNIIIQNLIIDTDAMGIAAYGVLTIDNVYMGENPENDATYADTNVHCGIGVIDFANVTIEYAEIYANGNAISSAVSSSKDSMKVYIKDGIYDVTLSSTNTTTDAWNYPPVYWASSGTITIDDGTFTGVNTSSSPKGTAGFYAKDGTVIINGGEFDAYDGLKLENASDTIKIDATVYGGTFTGTRSGLYTSGWDDATTSLVIYSGTFTGTDNLAFKGTATELEDVTIYGGTFNEDVPATYLATGYTATTEDNTYWIVALDVDQAEAKINDEYYVTLAEAIADAGDKDTIKIIADIEVVDANGIDLEKDLSFVGAEKEDGTKYMISANSSATSGGYLFNVIDEINLSFENLAIYVMNLGIEVGSAGDGSSIDINNCYFSALDNDHTRDIYYVRGDSSTSVDDTSYAGKYYYYNLSFTNNVVEHGANISDHNTLPVHIKLGAGNELYMDGNTFIGYTEKGSSNTILVWDESAKITITNNEFSNMYRTINVRFSEAMGDWTFENNAFIGVTYAVEVSSANANNKGFDLGCNYFGETEGNYGTTMVLLDQAKVTDYDFTEDILELSNYPYYKTYNNGVLSNLYELDEDGVAPGTIATVTDDNNKEVVCYTWEDVLKNIKEDSTVELHDNVEIEETVELTKSVTIDGGESGYTIETSEDTPDNTPVFKVTKEGVTITIQNCAFDASNTEYLVYGEYAYNLVFENNDIAEGTASLIYMPLNGSNTLKVTTKY